MIKNERQYKMTKHHYNNFKHAISDLEKKENTRAHQLEMNSLQSQMIDLQREIDEYDDLKSGMITVFELNSIDELPKTLIKARISLGFSQKKLGMLIGLQEQQIQRYESTDYESASISRIKEVARALNLEIEKTSYFTIKNFQKNISLKK